MRNIMNSLGPWTVLLFLVALLDVAHLIKKIQKRRDV